MSQAERDAIDIFGYLYPMLSSGQKETSEGRRAREIADKYKPFLRDTSKINAYDRILDTVRRQLLAERSPHSEKEPRRVVLASRADAYDSIVQYLSSIHAMGDIRLGIGKLSATPVPIADQLALTAPKKAAKPKRAKKPSEPQSSS